MIFEQIATGGCQSYLVGCGESCAAALIDPEASQIDRYLAQAARDGLRIHFIIDTHTHADHFSASRELARQLGVPTVMHRASPARTCCRAASWSCASTRTCPIPRNAS